VDAHTSYTNTPYGNLTQVLSELNYLGVHNIRDNVANTTQEYNALGTLMSNGIKVDMLANTDLTGFMNLAHNLEVAHPGGINAIEGLNEVDGWSPSYKGLTSYAAAAQFQKDLYTAVKSDSVLSGVAVYNTTVAGVADSQYLGNLSAYADYGNAHIYYGGGQPGWGWSTYDSTYFWTSWLKSAQVDAPNKPVVVTETGASTAVGSPGYQSVDQPTAAKQILNSLMDSAKNGVSMTYIYELVDSQNNGATDPQSHFGLFNWDGSATVAANAVHNFTSILTSHGALSSTPGSLDYTISGVPTWGGQQLFQQGDGTYDIVVWAEPTIWNTSTNQEVAAGNTPITINLANAASVKIYDPMTGSTATQSLGATSTVSFNVVDHPLIVEVTPTSTGSTGGATTTPPATGGTTTSPPTGGSTTTPTTPVADPAADFNGDGKSDMLLYNASTNQISVLDSTGSGFKSVMTTTAPAGWTPVGVADFNGDGKSDILWYNSSTHTEAVWTSTGSSFTGSVTNTAPAGWTPVGTGDFNGDGKADIFWYNASANQETVWQSTGSNFQGTAVITAPTGFKPIGIGDFNGDGKADVLWYNSTNNQISVQNSNGSSFQSPNAAITAPAGWTPVGVGDFNGDGKADIVWYNASTHQETVWTSTGSSFSGGAVNSVPTGWAPVSVGDYNGDGKADIMFYNSSTHQEAVWQTSGSGVTSWASTSVTSGYTPFDTFQTGTYGLHQV
jgi:hypothetical protein